MAEDGSLMEPSSLELAEYGTHHDTDAAQLVACQASEPGDSARFQSSLCWPTTKTRAVVTFTGQLSLFAAI
jgi:hypothetical protein